MGGLTPTCREHRLESAKARLKTAEAILGDAAQQLRFAEVVRNPQWFCQLEWR